MKPLRIITCRYSSAFLISLAIIVFFCFLYPSVIHADVYVHDAVAVQGEEVRLKAETRGTLFTQGGELVEFFIDDASLGKNLSGGDGFAYRYYTAARPGLKAIRAVSRNTEGTGYLLVLKRGAALVAVDVEGALLFKGFMFPGRPDSRQTLESIAKRYPLIYLQTGETSPKAVRFWLREYEYPGAPMLTLDEGSVFDGLEKKGLKIRAVIGGPAVIESAASHKPQAFSFDAVKGAVRLKSWKEVGEKLK